MIIDYTKISNIQFDDIDHDDAPDYCDAYIVSADYCGEQMSMEQIDTINSDKDFVYSELMNYLY